MPFGPQPAQPTRPDQQLSAEQLEALKRAIVGAPGAYQYAPSTQYTMPSDALERMQMYQQQLAAGQSNVPMSTYAQEGRNYDMARQSLDGLVQHAQRLEQRQASAIIAVTGTVLAAAATAMFTTAYMKHTKGPLSTMYLVLAIACGCCTALIGLIGLVRFMS